MLHLRKETINEDQYSLEDAGWDACLEGLREGDNPYPVTNWKHYDWEKGWELAHDQLDEDSTKH